MSQQNNQQQVGHDSNSAMQLSRPVPPTYAHFNGQTFADICGQPRQAGYLHILGSVLCSHRSNLHCLCLLYSIIKAVPVSTLYLRNKEQLETSNLKGCSNPSEFDNNNILQCNPNDNLPNITDGKVGVAMIDLKRENQFAVVYYEFYIIDNKVPTESKLQSTQI